MQFKKWLLAEMPWHSSPDDIAGNIRVSSPHKSPTHDSDVYLAWLQYKKLDALANQETRPAKMRELIRQMHQLKKIFNGKIDPNYREVDVAGVYADKTLKRNQDRFGGHPGAADAKTRVYLPMPKGKVLDVATDDGFEELLVSKKEAAAMSGDYGENLRQILLKKGYEAVINGGIRDAEEEEVVFLSPDKQWKYTKKTRPSLFQ